MKTLIALALVSLFAAAACKKGQSSAQPAGAPAPAVSTAPAQGAQSGTMGATPATQTPAPANQNPPGGGNP